MLMRSRSIFAVTVAMALVLSACSGSGDDETADTAGPLGEDVVVTDGSEVQLAAASGGEPVDGVSLALSAEMPYDTRFIEVNGSNIAYVEAGEGDPILFLQSRGVPNYEAVFLGAGSHFLQEDHPESIGRNISDWYRRLGE